MAYINKINVDGMEYEVQDENAVHDVDATLTKEGQAADAKAVGDALEKLENMIPAESGTTDYTAMSNKPQINGVELSGNKTSSDLGIGDPTDEQVASAVETWLDAHPEATTTVEDGSLEWVKIKNTQYFKNYFDVSTFASGYINNGIFTAQSTAIEESYYRASDFIKWVGPVTHFTIRTQTRLVVRGVHFYDGNKTYLSKGTTTFVQGAYRYYTVEVPDGAVYMRFDTQEIVGATWADGLVVWPDSTVPDNLSEYYLVDEAVDLSRNVMALEGGRIADHSIKKEKLERWSITSKEVNNIRPESLFGATMRNLFNFSEYVFPTDTVESDNVAAGWYGSSGNFTAADNYTTVFFPCIPGKTYYVYWMDAEGTASSKLTNNFVHFFDEKKVWMDKATVTAGEYVVTVPTGAYFMGITALTTGNHTFEVLFPTLMVTDYGVSDRYYDYVAEFPWMHIRDGAAELKVLCYGDSLTSGKYPDKVAELLGCMVKDAGAGGATCNYINSVVGNYGTDFDVVTLMVGTNDNGGTTACPLGTVDDEAATDDNATATDTTYAARLKRLLNTIKSIHRGATFVIMPPFEHTWSNFETLTALMKGIAKQYKMPFLDIYHLCGWDGTDEEDAAIFMTDGTHENDVGAQRIAELLAGFIKTLKGA